MSFSPLSIILVTGLIIIFIKYRTNENKYIYYIIALIILFESFINRGYFVFFAFERPLFYNEFLIIIVSPFFLSILIKEKFSKTIFYLMVGYFYSILIGLLFLYFNEPDFKIIPIGVVIDQLYYGQIKLEYISLNLNHAARLLRTILYLPIVIFFGSNIVDHTKVVNIVLYFTKIMVILIILEFALKLTGHVNYYDIILSFIFDDNVSILGTRVNYFTLQGLTLEPSHLSYGFFAPVFMLATSQLKVKNMILLICILFILLYSLSFSNFILAVIGVIISIMYNWKRIKNLESKYVAVSTIATLILIPILIYLVVPKDIILHNIMRLTAFITGDYIGSEGIRIWSVGQNMQYFLERPLFGLGLGSTISNGFIPSMLANIGIIGFLFWLMFHKVTLKIKMLLIPAMFMILFLFFTGDIGWIYSVKSILIFLAIAGQNKGIKV